MANQLIPHSIQLFPSEGGPGDYSYITVEVGRYPKCVVRTIYPKEHPELLDLFNVAASALGALERRCERILASERKHG